MRQEWGFADLLDGWKELLPLLFAVGEAGQKKVGTSEERVPDDLELRWIKNAGA